MVHDLLQNATHLKYLIRTGLLSPSEPKNSLKLLDNLIAKLEEMYSSIPYEEIKQIELDGSYSQECITWLFSKLGIPQFTFENEKILIHFEGIFVQESNC